MDCKINCETLTCEFCKRSVPSCNVKRNCSKVIIGGPGTEIKKILSRIGIEAKRGCKCNDRSRHIDYMESIEPGWTERNIENILDWMQEEAKKRKLPFVRAGAKLLVKLAIRRVKK